MHMTPNFFRRFSLLLGAALALGLGTARADTTVFAGSVVNETNVTNSGGALGGADGLGASIGNQGLLFGFIPFTNGGSLDLTFGQAVTGLDTMFTFLGSGRNGAASIQLGAIVNGVAVFTVAQTVTYGGGGGVFTLDFSAGCSGLDPAGCTLLRIVNNAGFGRGSVILDGVSGVSNAPEPEVWALMILGFIGVAARSKQVRAATPQSGRAINPPMIFQAP